MNTLPAEMQGIPRWQLKEEGGNLPAATAGYLFCEVLRGLAEGHPEPFRRFFLGFRNYPKVREAARQQVCECLGYIFFQYQLRIWPRFDPRFTSILSEAKMTDRAFFHTQHELATAGEMPSEEAQRALHDRDEFRGGGRFSR